MSDLLRWLVEALKLSDKVFWGLFLAALLLLAFDHYAIINLADFHALARPAVIVATVVCGSLVVAAACRAIGGWRRRALALQRRQMRLKEREAARTKYETTVLARLNYLNREQLRFVADALRQNSPSFTTWVEGPHVNNLRALGIVSTPGGPPLQDQYPFYFVDFVWAHLVRHREQFIAKEEEHKRREEAEEAEEAEARSKRGR